MQRLLVRRGSRPQRRLKRHYQVRGRRPNVLVKKLRGLSFARNCGRGQRRKPRNSVADDTYDDSSVGPLTTLVKLRRPSLITKDYWTLYEAFEWVGKTRFGKEWSGIEVDCFGGEDHRPGDEKPDRTQDDERYLRAREDLFEFLYEREDEVVGIAESGQMSSVPAYAWKCITGDFEIHIRDGKVWQGNRASGKSWRVRVDKVELQALLQTYSEQRRRSGQGDHKGKGGADPIYDWGRIDGEIASLYAEDPPPASQKKAAQALEAILAQMGISVPGDTSLRNRIRMLDEDGRLAKR